MIQGLPHLLWFLFFRARGLQGLVTRTSTHCFRNSLRPRRVTDFQVPLSVNCNIMARRVEQPYLVTNRTHSKEMCFSLWGLECCLVRPHTLCRGNTNTPTCCRGIPHQGALSRSSFPVLCAHMYTDTRFIYLPLSLTFFHFFSLLNEGFLGSETVFHLHFHHFC